jgi:beta-glucosidase
VVQLYINDVISSVTTYEKVLRGFERVVEPGIFQVMVGASSEDIRLEGSFEIR